MSLKKIRTLLEKEKIVQKAILKEIGNTFPVGSVVNFKKGNALIHAVILSYSDSWWSSPRCKIRNVDTGRCYWIHTFWFAK